MMLPVQWLGNILPRHEAKVGDVLVVFLYLPVHDAIEQREVD